MSNTDEKEQKPKRHFQWEGDKKIYVNRTEIHALPLFVRKAKEVAVGRVVWFAWPALDYGIHAHDSITGVMRLYADEEFDDKFLYLSLEQIKKFAEYHDGVTPEYVLRWDEDPRRVEEEFYENEDSTVLQRDLHEQFIKMIVDRTQVLDMPRMKVVWNAIVQTMAHWLLKKRRPLNLGLFTLCAVPYRANWKSILYGGYPKSHVCFTGSNAEVIRRMDAMGITTALMGRELLEVNKDPHWMGWALEAIPNRAWEDAVEKTQRLRYQHSGPEAYATYIALTIRRLRPFIVAAYRNFICRSVKPAGAISSLVRGGNQVIKPATPKGGIRPRMVNGAEGHIVFRESVDWEKPVFIDLIDEALNDVCALPDVRQTPSQLRITGGDVVQQEHGT